MAYLEPGLSSLSICWELVSTESRFSIVLTCHTLLINDTNETKGYGGVTSERNVSKATLLSLLSSLLGSLLVVLVAILLISIVGVA